MRDFIVSVAVVAALASAAAGQALDLEAVKALRDTGRMHFDASANVDLSPGERNEHRKKAFTALSEAFRILDAWCEAHPEDAERLDDLMVEIHQMRYWLRKESPMGLLEEDESNVRKGTPPDWPPAPPPEAPAPGVPAAPPKAPAQAVADHLKHAEEYGKSHPYDRPGLRDLYLDILGHAAPGSPEYEAALRRVSELNAGLKKAYRLLRDEDPDTLDLSGAEERSLVKSLAEDLKSREPDARVRAAQYLGLLSSGEAARPLVAALRREKVDAVREGILSALDAIGGYRVVTELATLSSGDDSALKLKALEVLDVIANRSSAEARHASRSIGAFVSGKDDAVADKALAALGAMGANGLFGLGEAVMVKNLSRRLRVVEALGACGDGRAAGYLGPFLVFGAKGDLRTLQQAAVAAITSLGRPAVPHLARFMGNPSLRQWTAYVLRQVTGESFESEEAVRAWWSRQGTK